MARKKIEPQINLLPQEEFDASTLGRVLKWLLSTFRYIVIATEMIVMLAFLSRFWLDAQSGDLIDKITQQKAIVASYSKFEDQFRLTQSKLTLFKKFSTDNIGVSAVVDEIAAKIPTNVSLTGLDISGPKIQLTAESNSDFAAANFVSNLSSSTLLTNVALVSVESKQGESATSFTITGIIKGGTNGS